MSANSAVVKVPLHHEDGAFTMTFTDLFFSCLDTLRTGDGKQGVNEAGGAWIAGLQQPFRRAADTLMSV